MSMKDILVVGAGFSGAVLARCLAEKTDARILVIDSRSHVAGNCHTSVDDQTGIMVHRYGPHIFNTSHYDVWEFIGQFCSMQPYTNRVKVTNASGVYSFPINLHTINQFFGKRLSPSEARSLVRELSRREIVEPKNFEEQALSLIGRELYEAFFYGYTKKQWGCEPKELPASILKRIPIRFNYDDNYYQAPLQGIPAEGYTAVVTRMLSHPRISLLLETAYDSAMSDDAMHTFYSGSLDSFFGYRCGRLGYRTVEFKEHRSEEDFQGCAVMNYTDVGVPFTRIHEHKYFSTSTKGGPSISFIECSKETSSDDTPYYPKRLPRDIDLLASYERLADGVENVTFLGRLGTYRYLDMDVTIGEAMDLADKVVSCLENGLSVPVFGPRRSK